MSNQNSSVLIQTLVTKFSPNLLDRQVNNCTSYISDLCTKYKAKFYNAFDQKMMFRTYDEHRRIRYLTFEFKSHLVTIKYGTKRSPQNIKIYLAV